jgi:hypothetical protein
MIKESYEDDLEMGTFSDDIWSSMLSSPRVLLGLFGSLGLILVLRLAFPKRIGMVLEGLALIGVVLQLATNCTFIAYTLNWIRLLLFSGLKNFWSDWVIFILMALVIALPVSVIRFFKFVEDGDMRNKREFSIAGTAYAITICCLISVYVIVMGRHCHQASFDAAEYCESLPFRFAEWFPWFVIGASFWILVCILHVFLPEA